jgi:predicted nucleotidyltransferase
MAAYESKDRVDHIMAEITQRMREIFGEHLRQVILFGSYARGEQQEYSDMDVMVLVALSDAELNQYNDVIVDAMCDISLRHGVLPTVIEKNYEHFYQWVPFLPFYRNVKTEGIDYYAS